MAHRFNDRLKIKEISTLWEAGRSKQDGSESRGSCGFPSAASCRRPVDTGLSQRGTKTPAGTEPVCRSAPPPPATMPVALPEPLAVPGSCFSVRLRHPDSRPFLKTLGSLSGPVDGASSQPPGSQRHEVAPKSAVPCRPGSDVW